MKYILSIIILAFFVNVNSSAQNSDLKLNDIIDGTWKIDVRLPAVDINNPEAADKIDYKNEILKDTDSIIVFSESKFKIDNTNTGNFSIKGTSLYLNGVKYKYGIYSKDKFSLIRIVSPELILTYMIERKK